MKAIAIIKRCDNDKNIGEIHFKETDQGVHIYGVITNLTNGFHGIHIHKSGYKNKDSGS